MMKHSSLSRSLIAAAALTLIAVAPTRADIFFTFGTGTIGGGNDNNLLFQPPQTGPSVTGTTQQGGVDLVFTSATQQLVGSGGQATLDTTTGLLTGDVTVAVEAGFGLSYIEFLPFPQNGDPTDQFRIIATDQFGQVTTSGIFTGSTGDRILSFGAGNPTQFITSFTFDVIQGEFEDLRQFRVSGQALPGAVPEPGMMAFAATSGLGLVGMIGRVRLRRRKPAA